MAAPTSITQWMQNLPIVWLTGNTNGAADAAAQGSVYDGQVDLIKSAVEARFPDTAPADGLPYVGDNFGLIQGKQESDSTFRIRCKAAWDQWALAGTWAELLFQLYFTCGLEGVSIVQQNGLVYSLSSAPGPTDDPTELLIIDGADGNPSMDVNPAYQVQVTITTGGALGTMAFSVLYNGVTYGPTTSRAGDLYSYFVPGTRTVLRFKPASYVLASFYIIAVDGTITTFGGATFTLSQTSAPWWRFDDDDDKCSRFALLIDGPVPSSMAITSRLTFDGTTGTVTGDWSYPFDGADYLTALSVVTTDGSSPVVTVTAQDASTVTVTASAPFTGYVDLLGWTAGSNPFCSPSLSLQNLISLIVERWKPAKAIFMGTVVDVSGYLWGWPLGTRWGQAGLKWGDSMSVRF